MKYITFSKVKKFIGFSGITAADKVSPNEIRKMTASLFSAINTVFKPRTHRGRAIEYTAPIEGQDEFGTFTIWKFPVFVTNKDEMIITVKVWTGEVHGGSCNMWCQPAYKFTDGQSAVQFETMLNTAIDHAITMMKRYTRQNMTPREKGGKKIIEAV